MSLDYSKIPLLPPPPGIVSNFVDPVSFSTTVITLSVVFLTLSSVFLGGRIYSKFYITHTPSYDDWACLVAWIFAAVYAILVIHLIPILKHSWDIPVSNFTIEIVVTSYVTDLFCGASIFLSKLSLFLLFRKLFSVKRYMRILINFGIVFAFGTYMTIIPVNTYYCTPRNGQTWLSPDIHCDKAIPYAVAQGTLNIIVDLYILCLPIPIVWGLNVSSKKKLSILSIFMVGILGIISGIIGLYYRILLFQTDVFWNDSFVYAVIIVETNIAIICCSMPSFSAIFRHHFAKSHYFSYMLTRLRVWGRSRESKPNSSGFQKRKLSNENTKEGMYREELGELPEIPSGEMSKIRTFIRKINRSAGESTAGQFTLDEGYTMMDNNQTCANDGIEVVSNRTALQDQNRKQGLGVLDIV